MAFTKTIDKPLNEARTAITESLAKFGFGVLTEIDVAATLKTKIGVEREPLVILGACNPNLANEALTVDVAFALWMPCNVVLQKAGAGTTISIIDPHDIIKDDVLKPLADKAQALLTQALEQTA
ncbi:MAG: DUF302 domain-containing protein [Actinomycetota bacterium]|nr:DUF302 domain-containing protein [Actinomycetota bacterium]